MKFLTHDGVLYFWGKIKNYIDTKYNELFQSVSNGKKSVANAITGKGVVTNATDTFATMATNIGKITTGVETNDATAVAGEILSGKTAYVKGSKVTGTMANRTFSVESAYTRADKLLADGTGALCVAPPPGYYDDAVNNYGFGKIICIDDNYNGSNIRKGVSIFGVQGTYEGLSPNGSTKSYYAYAGQNIQAGDFIKYVSGVAGIGSGNSSLTRFLNNVTLDPSYAILGGVAISDTKFVVLYATSGQTSIKAIVGTFNGATLSLGNELTISGTTVISPDYLQLIKVSSTRVAFAMWNSTNNRYRVHVLDINGSNISNTYSGETAGGSSSNTYVPRLLHHISGDTYLIISEDGNSYRAVNADIINVTSSLQKVTSYSLSSSGNNWAKMGVNIIPNTNVIAFTTLFSNTSVKVLRINFSSTGFSYIGEYTTYKDGLILYSNSFDFVSISFKQEVNIFISNGSSIFLIPPFTTGFSNIF
jgi:hypothetical protein